MPRSRRSSTPQPDAFRGLVWGVGLSSLLWVALAFSWGAWGWWGPPAVLAGSELALLVAALARRDTGR